MDFILQNLLLVACTIVSGAALIYVSIRQPAKGIGVTPTQATLLINREDAQVIDVRETDEYVSGHVPEARNIPVSAIDDRLADLEKNKDVPLIVVCQSGARSAKVVEKLRRKGFAKVFNLSGGVAAWREAGLPLKKGAKK